MNYLYLVLLFVLGILMAAKPELLWKIEHFFTTKGGEPTDFYRITTVIGGVALVLATLVLFFWSLAV